MASPKIGSVNIADVVFETADIRDVYLFAKKTAGLEGDATAEGKDVKGKHAIKLRYMPIVDFYSPAETNPSGGRRDRNTDAGRLYVAVFGADSSMMSAMSSVCGGETLEELTIVEMTTSGELQETFITLTASNPYLVEVVVSFDVSTDVERTQGVRLVYVFEFGALKGERKARDQTEAEKGVTSFYFSRIKDANKA